MTLIIEASDLLQIVSFRPKLEVLKLGRDYGFFIETSLAACTLSRHHSPIFGY